MAGPQKKEKQKPIKFFGLGEDLPQPKGFNLPMPVTLSPEEDALAKKERLKLNPWKRRAEGAVSGLLGSSLLGYEPGELDPETEQGMAIGELEPLAKVLGFGKVLGTGLAMMPFPYGKRIAHATKNWNEFRDLVNKGFDMNLNRSDDILGHMTHLTTPDNPEYSQSFGGPTMLATLKTNNYVDLNNLTPDDIARIYGQLSPSQQRYLKSVVKDNVKLQRQIEPDPLLRRGKPGSENYNPERAKLLREGEARSFVEKVPESKFDQTGIEAYRYHDLGDADRPAIATHRPDIIYGAFTDKPLGGKARRSTYEGKRLFEVSPSGEAEHVGMSPVTEIKPDYPFIYNPKTKPFHDEFEGNIISPSATQKVEDRFTNKGQAGGTHGARIVTSQKSGDQYVYKPQSLPFLNLSEYISTKLSNMINGVTPVAKLTQGGTVQRFAGDFPSIRELGTHEDFILQHPDLIPQIQQEHVVDWLIGNHDAHGGNFLFDEANNRLIPVDKGQAFKYYNEDRLASDYHPNQKFGESEPIYNTLLRLAREGKVQLDPNAYYVAAKKAKDQIASLPKVMREYANARFGPGIEAENFLRRFEERKNNLTRDFSTLLSNERLKTANTRTYLYDTEPPSGWGSTETPSALASKYKSITDIPNPEKSTPTSPAKYASPEDMQLSVDNKQILDKYKIKFSTDIDKLVIDNPYQATKLAKELGIKTEGLTKKQLSAKIQKAYDYVQYGFPLGTTVDKHRPVTKNPNKPPVTYAPTPPSKVMAEKGKGWGTLSNPFDSENGEKVINLAEKFGLNWNKYSNYYELGKAVLQMQKAAKHHVPTWLSKPYGMDTKPAKIIK